MKLTPDQTADLVDLVSLKTGKARVMITGTSMRPLLRAGMVVDVEPFARAPRVGDIAVFRTANGLVAHRVVNARVTFGDDRTAFVTSGDAVPVNVEVVDLQNVVGHVNAVWSNSAPGARRIDSALHRGLGLVLARTRRPRSLAYKMRETLAIVLADPKRSMPPRAFVSLERATIAFENGRYAEGVTALCATPLAETMIVVKSHHASGLLFRWLEDATARGIAVPRELTTSLQRIRWTTALQAGRLLTCAADIRDRLDAANVAHIFLKGGARLASGAADADIHYSGDIDVLVPLEHIEAALTALRSAGYREHLPESLHAHYRKLHHRAPLQSPHVDVPIEVHISLSPQKWVTRPLDFSDLAPHALFVDGPVGRVRVLDRVLSALHLAYHGRDFRTWRDIVLLSRLLRDFDTLERDAFDSYVRSERRDGIRLRSTVASADAITNETHLQSRSVKRYLAWATRSQDLPRRIARNVVVEVALGRYLPSEVRYTYESSVVAMIRGWGRSLLLLPTVLRFLAKM